MGDVVNLRLARKARGRAADQAAAAAARTRHGRTRAERQADADEAERRGRILDGARLEDPSTPAPSEP